MQIGIGNAFLQFRDYRNHFDDFKKYAMIFDQLHIIYLNDVIEKTKELRDLKYLQDRGFLSDATSVSEGQYLKINDEQPRRLVHERPVRLNVVYKTGTSV